MILGIGVDLVDSQRFVSWTTYSRERLRRMFSASELDYCFAVPACTVQRLAVRFAAREAFFKALGGLDSEHAVPFLTVCRSVVVEKKPSGVSHLVIDWPLLHRAGFFSAHQALVVHSSLTHTASSALAWVMITAGSCVDTHSIDV